MHSKTKVLSLKRKIRQDNYYGIIFTVKSIIHAVVILYSSLQILYQCSFDHVEDEPIDKSS